MSKIFTCLLSFLRGWFDMFGKFLRDSAPVHLEMSWPTNVIVKLAQAKFWLAAARRLRFAKEF